MKKLLIIIIAAVAIIVVSILYLQSLSSDSLVVTRNEMEQAQKTNNGIINRHIEISKDDTLKVTLYAHWSSGMKWSVSDDGSDIISQDGERQFTNDGLPFTIGSPGHEDWFFKATNAGNTIITMTYNPVGSLPDASQNVNTLLLEVEID